VSPWCFRLGLFSLALATQVACSRIEVRTNDVSVEGTAKGELLVHFTLDQGIEPLGNPNIFAYMRVEGQVGPVGYNATAKLQEVGPAGEGVRYQCQFPLKAALAGTYDYDGIGGQRVHSWVEGPYDLERPGEYELEFSVHGGGWGPAIPSVTSTPVRLGYRRP
jgi:hypothetical protein